jgi:hypothetical protein
MGLLKAFRSRIKSAKAPEAVVYTLDDGKAVPWLPPDILPVEVLQVVFRHLCPHSTDDSYDESERSGTEDACMLCGIRDLAHCVSVNKTWAEAARPLL